MFSGFTSSLAGGCLTSPLGVAWSQSSNEGYFSHPYGSWTALPNRCLKTPDSRDATSRITVTHRLVFSVTDFTALLVTSSSCGRSSVPGLAYSQPRVCLTTVTRCWYATAYNIGLFRLQRLCQATVSASGCLCLFPSSTSTRLSTDLADSESESVTLRLAVYRPSVRLGAKPLEDHDQRFFSTKHLLS
jgi:hypothetical protein